MTSAAGEIRKLADEADGKMKGASTSIDEARIVGELGIEAVTVVAALLDRATARIDGLESELKKLRKKVKKPPANKG